jgi:hypothetical protein
VTTKPRGTCPVCSRPITLKADGKLRHHNDPARKDPRVPFGFRCNGTGTAPEDA